MDIGPCKECDYQQDGLCRRFPPVPVLWPQDNQHPIIYAPAPMWPSVQPTDWCGEWK